MREKNFSGRRCHEEAACIPHPTKYSSGRSVFVIHHEDAHGKVWLVMILHKYPRRIFLLLIKPQNFIGRLKTKFLFFFVFRSMENLSRKNNWSKFRLIRKIKMKNNTKLEIFSLADKIEPAILRKCKHNEFLNPRQNCALGKKLPEDATRHLWLLSHSTDELVSIKQSYWRPEINIMKTRPNWAR